MYRCKITVLKRLANQDVIAAHMGEEYSSRDLAPCPNFTDGQEFIAESPGVVPDEFCAWAWAGIHKEIVAIMNGGDFRPWVKQPGTAIACCTDGFRPVVFRIERIDDEIN
ncbi:MAG: TIGR04076 family protein [Chloroflexota bacterium]